MGLGLLALLGFAKAMAVGSVVMFCVIVLGKGLNIVDSYIQKKQLKTSAAPVY